jgi:hypothetical protein
MNNNFLPSVVEIIYVAALLMRNADDWPESLTLPLPIMCIILGCNRKITLLPSCSVLRCHGSLQKLYQITSLQHQQTVLQFKYRLVHQLCYSKLVRASIERKCVRERESNFKRTCSPASWLRYEHVTAVQCIIK